MRAFPRAWRFQFVQRDAQNGMKKSEGDGVRIASRIKTLSLKRENVQ